MQAKKIVEAILHIVQFLIGYLTPQKVLYGILSDKHTDNLNFFFMIVRAGTV